MLKKRMQQEKKGKTRSEMDAGDNNLEGGSLVNFLIFALLMAAKRKSRDKNGVSLAFLLR